ncbi:hypothetical protein [Acidovorax sp.]|jgi:hypothetical protein|uniref:hypothetical protein n=1 Tax=Acidovorax sp. TaxID=1872122 RepID=UPI0025B82F33|nr:hypothetical protein [Acidovorax sp.]MCI5070649.1 hypothetical protein [Acidovorax sp.]
MNAPASTAAAIPPSRTAQRMAWVLDGLLLMLCALLVALSYYGFTLYCESFGCLGRGLVWMLWAVLAAGGSAMALGVRAWQRHRGLAVRVSGMALALMLAMGAGHFAYWLATTALR